MNNESAYWLALINASGLKLSKIKPMVQQWRLAEGNSLVELFNLSVKELSGGFNLTETEAQNVLNAARTHSEQLQKIELWQAQGIETLPVSHPHFPSRFVYNLPPIQQPLLLWARGETQLLAEPAITVLGESTSDTQTLAFLQSLIDILVEENIGVVSGYGKGLDRTAFEMILSTTNGIAAAVLPMGLSAFSKLTAKLDDPIAAGRAVLLSPFPPETTFKEALADARNLLVDSLAMALLVPQIDKTSQPRAQAALERGMPVLVGMTDSPESRDLIAAGAFLMTDPGEVIEMVQQAIIDNALQAQASQSHTNDTTDTPKAPSPAHPMLDASDDYALGKEAADPIAANEVLDILSAMGDVPTLLRTKLMAMEKQRKEEDEETE